MRNFQCSPRPLQLASRGPLRGRTGMEERGSAGLSQSAALFQLPFRLPCPSVPILSSLLPSSILKPARGLGSVVTVSLPSGDRGRSRVLLHCVLAKRIWLQSMSAVAMLDKMKANRNFQGLKLRPL